jgi:hypothetical protein
MASIEGNNDYLKAKIQIGNSKGPYNYNRSQTVFHHDDVPVSKRIRKEQVKEWAKSKILDPNRSDWQKSTHPNKPVVERRSMENHDHDRSHQYAYNYRAETVDSLRNLEPLDKSTKFHISTQLESTAREILAQRATSQVARGQFHRTQEMPVHPNLELKREWNSTIVLTTKEQEKGLDEKTKRAKSWTSKVNSTIAIKKEYISPMESTKLFQEAVRQQKFDGTFSTKEPVIRPQTVPEVEMPFKNRYVNDRPQKVTLTEHSGVWERNKVDNKYVSIISDLFFLSSYLVLLTFLLG